MEFELPTAIAGVPIGSGAARPQYRTADLPCGPRLFIRHDRQMPSICRRDEMQIRGISHRCDDCATEYCACMGAALDRGQPLRGLYVAQPSFRTAARLLRLALLVRRPSGLQLVLRCGRMAVVADAGRDLALFQVADLVTFRNDQ